MTARMYGNGVQTLSKSYLVRRSVALFLIGLDLYLDDFFVGIGDINSTFLPKIEPLTAATSPRPAGGEAKVLAQQGADISETLSPESQTTMPEASITSDITSLSTTIPVSSVEETERAQLAANAMLKQNNLALEAQLEERPLARKQEALQESDTAAHEHTQHSMEDKPAAGVEVKQVESSLHKHEKRKALLKNNDFELERVAKVRSYFIRVYNF